MGWGRYMKRILCYGDSNTWGYISGSDHQRYDETKRWPKLLQKYLGKKYEVIEEGLNSRTLCSTDERKGKEGRNGFEYLKPCLDTCDPIDFFVLMLGTNELKYVYNNSPTDILLLFEKYLNYLKNYQSQIDKSGLKIIVCGIPPINENTDYCKKNNKYKSATKKQKQLDKLLLNLCEKEKVKYVSNLDLQTGIDGVHITEESHILLAQKIYKIVKEKKL